MLGFDAESASLVLEPVASVHLGLQTRRLKSHALAGSSATIQRKINRRATSPALLLSSATKHPAHLQTKPHQQPRPATHDEPQHNTKVATAMRPSFTLACLALALAAKLSLAQALDISQPTVPTDIPAWDPAEMKKLHSASADAITLVSAAVSELTNASNPNHARTNSKLFAKYFAPGDADAVLDVFMSITGEGVSGRSDRLEQVYFSNTDVPRGL